MESMREIKRRIGSMQNTHKITKAMELVYAAKLRRAQEQAVSSRPYAEKMRDVIASITTNTDYSHPMLEKRSVKRTGYLVITSDRGLAGGYNANILRHVVQQIEERHASSDEYVLFVIGRKGVDFFKRRNYPVIETLIGLSDSPGFSDVKSIANRAVNMFADESFDELYIHYNAFQNAVTQIPTEKLLLPLADVSSERTAANYDYEPSEADVLAALLPKYAETVIYSVLLEAKASEHGARMTAMGNASENADEMISTLTLQFNRARQAAITQEIAEITAGANAL